MLIALVALASCAKTEDIRTSQQEVSFFVAQYASDTKSGEVSLNSENITSFRSKAFLHAEGVAGTQNFFPANGETISYNGSVPEWAPANNYYWPKSANSYVNFVSWYDKNGNPDSVQNISETAISWTIDGTNRSLASDDNIMIADEAWHYNDNATLYTSVSGVVEGVPTLFHHLLAKVCFRIKATPLTAEGSASTWDVTIKNFRVDSLVKTGSISMVNSDPGSNMTKAWKSLDANSVEQDPAWTIGNTVDTLKMNSSIPANGLVIDTDNTYEIVLGPHAVLPQATSKVRVRFTYEIRTVYSSNRILTEVLDADIPLSAFGTSRWEMNHIYTYGITINPVNTTILFDPEVKDDWRDDTGNKMYVE